MNNPLQRNNMFATPVDMESLMKYCERFTGGERVAALTAACMAWNLAHKMVEDEIKSSE
jgi:hypothetical protein